MYCLDKHVVKMPIESAQMMWTALHRYDESLIDLKPSMGRWTDLFYGASHTRHRCTLWCGDTRSNFEWLYRHGLALSQEFERRYYKKHKCYKAIKLAWTYRETIPEGELTPFAQAMPDEYKVPGDAVKAYRAYYHGEKYKFAKWHHGAPFWWTK